MDQWARPAPLIVVYPHEAVQFKLIGVSPRGRHEGNLMQRHLPVMNRHHSTHVGNNSPFSAVLIPCLSSQPFGDGGRKEWLPKSSVGGCTYRTKRSQNSVKPLG